MSAAVADPSSAPQRVLVALAEQLRADGSVISEHVRDPEQPPALGQLAAAGPRAREAAGEYALIVESVREGYLLHYGGPRVVRDADADLALLAGDYLYARGLERLAALGDLQSVRELSDLISLSAQLHAEQADSDVLAILWLAATVAVGCGPEAEHDAAKRALGEGAPEAAAALASAALAGAERGGVLAQLRSAGEAIGFPVPELPDRG